ncbi:Mercuric reductase [Planctomycetes bacterium Poly30]|uniref:Mercuric reductase n=1 Tax=Saltatorellus ferox TaxID=2528018 RepID=A0A518EPX8_9BACT|nr:Mercuric reductase [Planctomycetes bacterium Poly30]
MDSNTLPELRPLNEANQKLRDLVHPKGWPQPTPKGRYNLVVLGGGTAGLVAAAGAAGVGARVALVEKDLLGGDCLVTGCVPSKALIRSARAAKEARNSGHLGVHAEGVTVDFAAIMERMRARRSEIARNDSAKRFTELGVDVFLGEGRFTGQSTLEVGGQTLEFARAVVATGAKAAMPPIPGLADAGVLTNQTLFSLTELPESLIVVGGGPIGCEMAQTFARFGSKVTLVEGGPRIMSNDDPKAAEVVQAALLQDGVELRLSTRVERFEAPTTDGRKRVVVGSGSEAETIEAAEILLAIGRAPNVQGIGLETAGVDFDPRKGVTVDDRLKTSNDRIYAAGDVASKYQFTHAADFLARTVIRNALFFGRQKASDLVIPWATYTDPEVAHVGLTEAQAKAEGVAHAVIEIELEDNDRAVVDAETSGFVKILHDKKGKVLGGTVVASHAGEMIGELVTAVQHGTTLGTLSGVIHPYPTVADAIRRAGDRFNRTKLTPFTAGLLKTVLAIRR